MAQEDQKRPSHNSSGSRQSTFPETQDNNTQASATIEPQSPGPNLDVTRAAPVPESHEATSTKVESAANEQATPSHALPVQKLSPLVVENETRPSTTGDSRERIWQHPRQLADQWTWDILSCVVALLCVVSIVIILTIHRGRPLPQWPRMISINSLIAVFTALMKAALIFPVAEGKSTAITVTA